MPIRAVIFDFGGVLMRTEDQSPRQELAARLGVTREQLYYHIFDSPSARQATLGEISAGQLLALVDSLREGALNAAQVEVVRQLRTGILALAEQQNAIQDVKVPVTGE